MKFISICIISLSIGAAYGLVAAPRKLMARDNPPTRTEDEEQLVQNRNEKLTNGEKPFEKPISDFGYPAKPITSNSPTTETEHHQAEVDTLASKIRKTEENLRQYKKKYFALTGKAYTNRTPKQESQLPRTQSPPKVTYPLGHSNNHKPGIVNYSDDIWHPATETETVNNNNKKDNKNGGGS
ncbi:hypothetical protein CROQUDRAFT_87653 [Cronartium quercuum f. sp. fusiforme G11]|uniref:Uncharacterized protein n=1 Tax=Cronartium quercuum f. sp. fusiforme G11 TaxID=708437 RepID=A0A9P6NV88_9BASI|nr:hypothetical protein CROQUDRAFT_87653 [Cronartium quercuum f. sp. fusiforme G11]